MPPTPKDERRKLTPDQVRTIRNRHHAGARQADLAREYGMSPATIHQIIRRVLWRDLPDDPEAA